MLFRLAGSRAAATPRCSVNIRCLLCFLFVCLFVYLFVLQFDVQSDNWIISSGYVECLSVSRRNGVLWLKILPRPHITDQPTKQIFSAMQSSMCTISILSVCVCLCLCVCFVFFSINKCPKGVRILSPSLPACVCLPPHGWVSPWIYPEGTQQDPLHIQDQIYRKHTKMILIG